jgi:hypothetical protein
MYSMYVCMYVRMYVIKYLSELINRNQVWLLAIQASQLSLACRSSELRIFHMAVKRQHTQQQQIVKPQKYYYYIRRIEH